MRVLTFFLAAFGLLLARGTIAGLENVTYPIAELGGCENQDTCYDYCSEPSNFDACIAYAEQNDLLEEEEIQEYRQVQELVAQGGPGGCTSEPACEAYCSDLNNIQECLVFAQDHGLMNEEEIVQARKVQSALESGAVLPGGCSSEETCETYCSNPNNSEECLSFAQTAGLMTHEEIEEARQVMTILQSGSAPGGCKSQNECEAYCEGEAHQEECMAFAVEAGFMTQEESERMRETVGEEIEAFVGPGGCTDEASCRGYCEQEQHREECGIFVGEEIGDGFQEWIDMEACLRGTSEEGSADMNCPVIREGINQGEFEYNLQLSEIPLMQDQITQEEAEGDFQVLDNIEVFDFDSQSSYETLEEQMIEQHDGSLDDSIDLNESWDLQYEYPPSFHDTGGEAWEQFDPGEVPIQLVPQLPGGQDEAPAETHSILRKPNAGFVESVRRFFQRMLMRTN